jgi:metallo-beta-lactamase family protein
VTTAAEASHSELDALDTMDRFGLSVVYGTPVSLRAGVTATFLDAGHILGSANILLDLTEGDSRLRILFSGDLGSGHGALLRRPAEPPRVDVVVMESLPRSCWRMRACRTARIGTARRTSS